MWSKGSASDVIKPSTNSIRTKPASLSCPYDCVPSYIYSTDSKAVHTSMYEYGNYKYGNNPNFINIAHNKFYALVILLYTSRVVTVE